MKKLLLVAIALVLILAPSVLGQDDGFPICDENQVLILVGALLDYEIVSQASIETLDDLIEDAGSYIDSRDSSLSLLPLCQEAIYSQRNIIALKGDIIGATALALAGVSSNDNAYLTHELVDLAQIDEILEGMLGAEDGAEQPEEPGEIRYCARDENSELDNMVAEFLAFELSPSSLQRDALLTFIDLLLAWREEKLSQLPECAQAIELGFLLTKATTDAATGLALSYAGQTNAANRYDATVSQARAILLDWRANLKLTTPAYKGATVLALGPASELPPCSSTELTVAYSATAGLVMNVVELGQNAETGADLAAYFEAHIELRDSILAQLPLCSELFEFGWLAREILVDTASWASLNVRDFTGRSNPYTEQVKAKTVDFLAWIENTTEYLGGIEGVVGPAPDEREVSLCRSGEILYLIGYLLPEFREFVSDGIGVETGLDIKALVEQSFVQRDQLWSDLPRCQEALEIGLVMRQVAGDFVAMFNLDLAEADSGDYVPYLEQIKSGLDEFYALNDALPSQSSRIGDTYYVTAERGANIRSCASTSCDIVATAAHGEALTVVDDSSDWYELFLEGGRSGYIAGFLVSATPPG